MGRDRNNRITRNNETNGRSEFIETYIRNTLNEIKEDIKNIINLEEEKEEKTDEKMSIVLKELIDANFKNVNVDGYGNLIHTLLPLTDKKENDKIRRSLILYYTALYFDNVDLLNRMLKEEVDFGYQLHDLKLYLLDKDVTSRFEGDEYIEVVKDCGELFFRFNLSTKNLTKEEKEEYITRFVSILKARHSDLVTDSNNRFRFYYLFSKYVMDVYEDASYYYATKDQLAMMSGCGNSLHIKNEDTIKRLNNLVQTTAFSGHFWNMDLMFSLFSDEELQGVDYWTGSYFDQYSETPEMLDKAKDLYARNRQMAKKVYHCTKETFMQIDNDTLIEIFDDLDSIPSDEWVKLKAVGLKPKVMLKRMLKKY